MKTSFEGKGIYAGNLTFLLSVICGASGAVIGVMMVIDKNLLSSQLLIDALSYGCGMGAVGTGAGAVLGLLLGSTAARSFHCVFCAAWAWALSTAALLFSRGSTAALRSHVQWHSLAGLLALVIGAAAGAYIGKNSVGFSGRAQKRALMVFALTTGAAFAASIALLSSMGVPAKLNADSLAVIGLASVAIGLFGAMMGAMVGADRSEIRGFSILQSHADVLPSPVQPLRNPPPSA
jgi:hypothetical protein